MSRRLAGLKAEALRLRRREQLSAAEIAGRLGVAYTTAYAWVGHIEVVTHRDCVRRESDLCLAVLCLMVRPGDTCSLQEIADVMGITRERVRQIEAAALMKVRKRMRAVMPSARTHSVGDLLETLLSSGPTRGRTGAHSK